MDDFWSPEGLAFKAEVREFAHSLGGDLDARDTGQEFCRKSWQACADFGLLGLCIPKEYGGSERSVIDAVLAMEGLGAGCRDNGLTLGLNAQIWTTQTSLLEFGSDEQKRQHLPALCSGERIAVQAMTEAEHGSDVFSLETRATRTEGGYVLDGEKVYVTLGPVADIFLVFATVAPERGRWGVTAFIVERGMDGFSIGPTRSKMGLRTAPLGDLELRGCFVPESARLGAEGAGVAVATAALDWERSCMAASQLGMLEAQLDTAVSRAREREQFGQPIGKFQSVSNRIADMKTRLEAARLLIYRVARKKMLGESAAMEAAMAKLFLGEALVEGSLDAVRIHGARGYLTEFGVERDLRDSVGTVLYGGTSDLQRVIIARLLGL